MEAEHATKPKAEPLTKAGAKCHWLKVMWDLVPAGQLRDAVESDRRTGGIKEETQMEWEDQIRCSAEELERRKKAYRYQA